MTFSAVDDSRRLSPVWTSSGIPWRKPAQTQVMVDMLYGKQGAWVGYARYSYKTREGLGKTVG